MWRGRPGPQTTPCPPNNPLPHPPPRQGGVPKQSPAGRLQKLFCVSRSSRTEQQSKGLFPPKGAETPMTNRQNRPKRRAVYIGAARLTSTPSPIPKEEEGPTKY